jgi:hypothetical protein
MVFAFAANGAEKTDAPPEARFPKELLQGEKAAEARKILEGYTLFRERSSKYQSTMKVYDYLWDRMPLSATMIRMLEFGTYKISKLPDGSYSLETGTGVTATFWIMDGGEGLKIIYGNGTYRGWLIRSLGGRATAAIGYQPEKDGDKTLVKNTLMVFVKVDNVVVDFFIRTFDWLIRLVVRNQIGDASSAAKKLTEAVAQNPAKVYDALRKSPDVSQEELEEFRRTFLEKKSVSDPQLSNSAARRGGQP